MKRKYKMEQQGNEVKISTILYTINLCQEKWKIFLKSSNLLVYDSVFVDSYSTA